MAASIPLVTIVGAVRITCRNNPSILDVKSIIELIRANYPHLRDKATEALSRAIRRHWQGTPTADEQAPVQDSQAEPSSIEYGKDSLIVTFPASKRIKTLADLLEAADVSLLEWEVERSIANAWETHAKVGDTMLPFTNHQVKAWLKPITRVTPMTVAEMAKILAPLVKRTGASFRPKSLPDSSNYLLELDMFDLHLGKLADLLETGQEYNLDIACDLYEAAVDALIARAAGYPIGEVLLPVGNDFYNSDTIIGSTTAGTPQHEAARWQRTFVRGTSLITATVNRIRERGLKVRIVIIPGNHDAANAFFLGQVLGATFSGCPDVSIDNTFSPRKYVQFHDCAIMYSHGNAEKEGNLPQIFAQEQPEMWAATRFREVHLAHIHHKKEFKYHTIQEHIGLTVRYMRSLSALDAWHHWKGYIGSQRSAEAFIHAKGEGVVAHLTYTYSGQDLISRTAIAA